VFINHKYTEWFGKPESEIMGKHMRDILGAKVFKVLKPSVDLVLSGTSCSNETVVHYPHAGRRFVQFSYTPDIADDGEVRGFYVLVSDLTDRKRAEDLLRTSEERMRVLMWSLTEHAVLSIDVEGRIDAWNRGAELLFGYEKDEMIGSTVERLFTSEDIANGVHIREMRVARQKGHAADDRWHVRKDGTRFFASGEITPVYLGKSLIGYAKIVRDLTNAKLMADQLQLAHDELEVRVANRTKELAEANALLLNEMEEREIAEGQRLSLLRRLFTVQEDERGRIARDMHDQLGQRITALRLKIASLNDLCADDPTVGARVNRLQEIAEHLDNEVSFMAWEMRPSILDTVEFAKALENYVSEWSRHSEILAEFDAIGVRDIKFDADLENNLYRITQEALNNAAKHAKASQIYVLLEKRGDELILIIEDNGVGFDTAEMLGERPGEKGFGLFGMRERAALISGTLEIESSNKGTSLFVRVPLS
jgi:PAS domain S-box-containing protein